MAAWGVTSYIVSRRMARTAHWSLVPLRLRLGLGVDPAAPIRRLPNRFHESRPCDLAVAGQDTHGVDACFLQEKGGCANDGIMDLQLNGQQGEYRLGQGTGNWNLAAWPPQPQP